MITEKQKQLNHTLELKYTFCCNLIAYMKKEGINPLELEKNSDLTAHSIYQWINAVYLIRYKDISNLPKNWDAGQMMLDQSNNFLPVINEKDKLISITPNEGYCYSYFVKANETIEIPYFKNLINDFNVYFQIANKTNNVFFQLSKHNLVKYIDDYSQNFNKDHYFTTVDISKEKNVEYLNIKKHGESFKVKRERNISKSIFKEYYPVEAVHCETKHINFTKESKNITLPKRSINNINYCVTSNILKLAKSKGYYYNNLAKALEIGERTIRSWIYKDATVRNEHLEALAKEFNCSEESIEHDIGNNYVSIYDIYDLTTMYECSKIYKRNRIGALSLSSKDIPTHLSIAVYNFNDQLAGFEEFKENHLVFVFTDINYVELEENNWYLHLIYDKEIDEMKIKWMKENNNKYYITDNKDDASIKSITKNAFDKKYNKFAVMTAFDYFYHKNHDINKNYPE